MRELSGTFFANIKFERVKTDILLTTEKVSALVGKPVMDRAIVILEKGSAMTETEKDFLQHVQLPIATGAAYAYYQGNNISHDENGRKAKIDKANESQAWQWQIDKDDEAALKKYRESLDRLVRYLDATADQDWIDSDSRKRSRELFLNNTEIFNQYFYIDDSASFYYVLTPMIREIQLKKIKPVLGEDYQVLIDAFQTNTTSADLEGQLSYIQEALSLHTMALAVKRLTIKVMPEGVVQNYRNYAQDLTSSNVAEMSAIKWYMLHLEKDADKALDDLRKFRSKSSVEAPLLPKNDPKNKYVRTS
jgi:hypothetical protein